MKKTRIQIHVDTKTWPTIDRLKTAFGVAHDVDFLRYAIQFLKFLVDKTEEGATLHIEGLRRPVPFDIKRPNTETTTKASATDRTRRGGATDGRRFQVELTQETRQTFDNLMNALHQPTRAALFRHSLHILSALVSALNDGGELCMVYKGRDYLVPLLGFTPRSAKKATPTRRPSGSRITKR